MQQQKGLYREELEKDACGIGMICNIDGIESHVMIDNALTMLENMEHRGACGCEVNTGDGAGLLLRIPHSFFISEAEAASIILPKQNKYAVGFLFLPKERELQNDCLSVTKKLVVKNGFELLWIRNVPTNNEMLGASAKDTEPDMVQIFVNTTMKIFYKENWKRNFMFLEIQLPEQSQKNMMH